MVNQSEDIPKGVDVRIKIARKATVNALDIKYNAQIYVNVRLVRMIRS